MTSTHSKQVEMACVSDIHLAHPRTSTHHIITNLGTALDEKVIAALDILFLAGDVFDRLMNLPQDEVDLIQEWIATVLRLCVKHNVRLRVLEGTPSHDWRQSKQFVNINETMAVKADLRYMDTLSIEVIDDLGGLTILYVPDEWNDDASVTLRQVQELMTLHNLKQVDIACMHGSFDYQLPIESVMNHDSDAYMALVKHYVCIGHVHIRTEKGKKILAQGSFDRLSHGEEAPKGYYRFSIGPNGKKHWFVENIGARTYLTLDCRTHTVDQTVAALEAYEDYPDQSRFRLLIARDSIVQRGIKDVRKRFPQFVITTQMDELKGQETVSKQAQQVIKPISITATNIGHLVSERLIQMSDTDIDKTHLLATLEQYARA